MIWRRAFEMSPYDPGIRSGLSRTSLDPPRALAYNLACLAALYVRGRRWKHAADAYRTLAQADRRRVDFQLSLAVALWQSNQRDEAYTLARHSADHHPHLLMAWRTLSETGDENDRALAQNPIATMDPDGEHAAQRWGVGQQDTGVTIRSHAGRNRTCSPIAIRMQRKPRRKPIQTLRRTSLCGRGAGQASHERSS